MTRNYLDWLTQVTYSSLMHSSNLSDVFRRSLGAVIHLKTFQSHIITHTQTVLDEDHYGLTDVKSRIHEFLTVGKLRGSFPSLLAISDLKQKMQRQISSWSHLQSISSSSIIVERVGYGIRRNIFEKVCLVSVDVNVDY
jgi:hypothetical protein